MILNYAPFVVVSVGLLMTTSCGKKSSSSSDDSSTSASTTTVTTSVDNSLAGAYPTGLSVSSPTSGNTTASLDSTTKFSAYNSADEESAAMVEEETKTKPPKEKAEEAKKILEGKDKASCRPKLKVKKFTLPSCYGGQVTAAAGATKGKNEAGVDVDNIFIPTTLQAIQNNTRGIRKGDAGIIAPNQGSDACLAATASVYVDSAAEDVDQGMTFVASMLCAAKTSGKDKLPGVGIKYDIKKEVAESWALPSTWEVKEASIENVGSEDDPAFRSYLSLKMNVPVGNKFESRTQTIELVNNPDAQSGDTKYKGRLVIFRGNGSDNEQGGAMVNGIVINYTREGDSLNTKLQRATFRSGASEDNHPSKFISETTGLFDFAAMRTKGDGKTLPKDLPAFNMIEATFDNNVNDNTGKFVYTWQAGLNDPATRAFVISVEADTATGGLKGCGMAGFGGQFGSADQGKVLGFFCGWAQNDTVAGQLRTSYEKFVQKQCFTQAKGATNWVLTDNNIKYSVAKDCGKTNTAVFDLVAATDTGAEWAKVPTPKEVKLKKEVKVDKDKLKTE